MREKKTRNRNYNTSESMKGGETQTAVVNSNTSDFDHIQPVIAKPLEVTVYNNGFEKALRAFRALVQKERILSAYKERQSYEKPSDKKRRKRNEMRRKRLELSSNKFLKRNEYETE